MIIIICRLVCPNINLQSLIRSQAYVRTYVPALDFVKNKRTQINESILPQRNGISNSMYDTNTYVRTIETAIYKIGEGELQE